MSDSNNFDVGCDCCPGDVCSATQTRPPSNWFYKQTIDHSDNDTAHLDGSTYEGSFTTTIDTYRDIMLLNKFGMDVDPPTNHYEPAHHTDFTSETIEGAQQHDNAPHTHDVPPSRFSWYDHNDGSPQVACPECGHPDLHHSATFNRITVDDRIDVEVELDCFCGWSVTHNEHGPKAEQLLAAATNHRYKSRL